MALDLSSPYPPLYPAVLDRRLKKGEKYYLFLDDTRHPHRVNWINFPTDKPWKIIRNYKQFVGMIEACGLPDFISFDMDLHDSHYELGARSNYQICDYEDSPHKTGLGCAAWLLDYCRKNRLEVPKFQCHSLNPGGRREITALLTSVA